MLRLGNRSSVNVFRNLIHAELQVLYLCIESILLKLHKHLLLDSCIVFVPEPIKGALKLIKLLLLLLLVLAEFLFLLLHSSVIDLLEVSLLSQFVVSRAGLLSNDSGFIKLSLESG